jgi:hypothetical protein
LRFHLDESLKKGLETLRLIDESMAEVRARQAEESPTDDPSDEASPSLDADPGSGEPE